MRNITTNIGAFVVGRLARIPEVITAGAGNDGVEVNGPFWSRKTGTRIHNSVKILIVWNAVLTAAKTLTLAANLQDADDSGGTNVADFGSATSSKGGGSEILASAVVATGAGTVPGVSEFSVDLTGAREWLRLQSTADLSNTVTDTVAIAAIAVLGPADELPAA